MGQSVLSLFRAAACWLALPAVMVSLAYGAAAGGDPDRPRAPATPATRPTTKPAPLPPIVFFLAKGDANACGPGCREWIAAEGTIDAGADGRLRALLKKLGGRKLPIYFHSPGGAIPAGLAIGRMMRARGLTAGVGRTVPTGCDPKAARDPACDKLERSGRELLADLNTASAMCNSACVFALVGAAVRDVGPGVRLGIHSASVKFSLKRIDARGHVTTTPTHVAPAVEQRALQANYDRIAAYMREMGIAPGLLAAARKISSDRLRYLSRDEIVAFGIDRREQIDGLWVFIDLPAGAAAVKVIQLREPAAGAFRRVILRLSCAGPDTLHLQVAREVGAERFSMPDRYRVKFGTTDLPLGRSITARLASDPLPLEVRAADLPMSVLGGATIVIEAATSASPSPDPSAVDAHAAKVTAENLGSGLSSLARRCTAPPTTNRGNAVEHI